MYARFIAFWKNITPTGIFRALLFAALVATFVMMASGSAVRTGDAASGCPDWPTCYGQWSLSQTGDAQVQVVHRALAALSAVLVLAGAVVARRMERAPHVRRALNAAAILMLVQVVLGGVVVLAGAQPLITRLHMLLAVLALGAVSAAAVLELSPASRLRWSTRFSRLSLSAMIAILILMVSGSLVVMTGASADCAGWPLCGGGLPGSGAGWLQFGHRLLTAVTGVLVGAQFLRAWRGQRSQPAQLSAATAVLLLTAGQVLIGALKVNRGFPEDLVWLHAVSSAALWASQVVLVVAAGLAARTQADESAEEAQPLNMRQRARDFLMLSKPLIVALLLVTTYAGMVVGGQEIPGLAVTFWTLLGGALAAGGSSALNQFIDRDIDGEMQRTARRPLPAGRLQPAEGLAYGIAACLAAFFLLAGFVNLLTALLSLAGMVYYVLIYSIWLKRLTVQNIVIGGGAGAIPPLVGWAAVTGSLNIPSLLLFAIIFLWTPPHFWALALVRRNDYARAQVPMLPVVRGATATRWQIFIYSLELVALTLLIPLFRITGSVYLISAVVLGAYLIYSAWRVVKDDGNKVAWRMYKYTSMYLMLLFLALVIDVLV